MATEKETVILDFKVDQGDAIQELERTKKVILDLKKEQEALNKAYKAGTITQEEYVSELVRVESVLKKTQSAYNNTQKSITGVKTKMDDLIKSNKDLTKSMEQGINNATIFGTNLGGLRASITALTNPVTAAVAVVGSLGAVYARSSIGAKDLEFAQNQLSASIDIISDGFAGLFSSVEDGQGILSRATDNILFIADVFTLGAGKLAQTAKASATAREELEAIQREAFLGQIAINERLSENAELRTIIGDAESKILEKQQAALKIQDNISLNSQERLAFINREIAAQEKIAETTQNKEKSEFEINKLKAERSNIERQETKELEKIQKQLNAILNTERKRREEVDKAIRDQSEREARERSKVDMTSFDPDSPSSEFDPQEQFEEDSALINAELSLVRTAEDEKRSELIRTNTLKEELAEEDRRRFEENLQLTEDNFNTIANLFSQGSEARRIFALAGIGADTASAIASLTAMSEANPGNAFTFGGAGIAQYAAGIIRILGNIVAAKSFLGGNFAGGGDFVTSKPTMLLVGDNPGGRERVTVEPLSGRGTSSYNPRSGLVKMAGGGSLTFDGNKEIAVASVQQNLQLRNSIKSMPRPVVGVDEIVRVMNRVEAKERVSV